MAWYHDALVLPMAFVYIMIQTSKKLVLGCHVCNVQLPEVDVSQEVSEKSLRSQRDKEMLSSVMMPSAVGGCGRA